MSVYPINLDTTFPGYPYTDYIENLDADQANAWVEGIIAIEETIGYGTPGTPNNPLYSQAYNVSYPTVTARIAALEGIVYNLPKVNTSNSVIQPVGSANLASATGANTVAAADHVHLTPPVVQVPIGGVILWPAEVSPSTLIPSNFMQCAGQGLPSSTYTSLFNIIGYKYGGAAGTFHLPNPTDRFPIGAGGAYASDVGMTGGSNSISVANLPPHAHPTWDNGHHHQSYIEDGSTGDMTRFQGLYTDPGSTLSVVTTTTPGAALPVTWSPADPSEGQGPIMPGYPNDVGHQNHWKTDYASIGTANVGSGSAYNPPYMGWWYLMRII